MIYACTVSNALEVLFISVSYCLFYPDQAFFNLLMMMSPNTSNSSSKSPFFEILFQDSKGILWVAGNKAGRLHFLPSPENPLQLQLRSSKEICDFADTIPLGETDSGEQAFTTFPFTVLFGENQSSRRQ